MLTTTRTILDHLYTTYANISSADLQEKDAVFRTLYDINQPIETLFDRVESVEITPPLATLHTALKKSSLSPFNLSTRPASLYKTAKP